MHEEVREILAEIDEMFAKKNLQYREGTDDLANFTKGALLRYGDATMSAKYETLKDYVNKHISHVYNYPLTGPKVDESLMDIAVYFIIALVMYRRLHCQIGLSRK